MSDRTPITSTWILVLSLGLTSGCEGHTLSGGPDPLDPQVVPQLSLVEATRIGGEDTRSEYLLSQVTSAAFFDDGSIAIASRMDHEIKIFSPTGTFIRAMGQEGGGPGEFRSLNSIVALPMGRLLAWDVQTVRATIFGADGEVEKAATLDLHGLDQLRPAFVGAFSDGRVVLMDSRSAIARRDEAPGVRRDTVQFVIFSENGEGWTKLLPVVGPEYFFHNTGVAWGKTQFLFGRAVHSGVSGDRLVVGNSEALSVITANPDGDRVDTLSLNRPLRPVDEEGVALEKERRSREAEALQKRREELRRGVILKGLIENPNLGVELLESIPVLPTLPAFADLLPAGDGTVLIRDALRPGSRIQRWFLMDRDFKPVAWIELDEAEQLLAATRGRILVLRKSPLDVESVHALEVRD